MLPTIQKRALWRGDGGYRTEPPRLTIRPRQVQALKGDAKGDHSGRDTQMASKNSLDLPRREFAQIAVTLIAIAAMAQTG